MRLRAFLPWSILGTGLWAATFTLVGYAFSDSFSAAAGNLTHGALALAIIAAGILAIRARQRAHKASAGDCSKVVSNRLRATRPIHRRNGKE